MQKPVINISDFIAKTGADNIVDTIRKQLERSDGSLPPVSDLIKTETEKPLFGLFGPEKINVLKLNIALNQLK